MILNLKETPRQFTVNNIIISDWGKIELHSEDMVSFQTQNNQEYDIVAKEWGFYATPSINGRLSNEGFKTALVKNSLQKFYILIVDTNELDTFHAYLEKEKMHLIEWLDERK